MSFAKKVGLFALLLSIVFTNFSKVEALTYVTDTGGYAYDESRIASNLAPAIALGTVAIVGIIALAVQNSHEHYSSHSDSSSSDYSYYSEYGSNYSSHQ